MKRFLSLILLLWTILSPCLFALNVCADMTTLSTSVPSEITLSLTIVGKGTVQIGDLSYSKSNNIPVPRHTELIVHFSPAAKYQIKSVILDGKNVTAQLVDGTLVLDGMPFDSQLLAEFEKRTDPNTGNNPTTGDAAFPCGAILSGTMALSALYLMWKYRQRLSNE